jgi:copper homeostasis protein
MLREILNCKEMGAKGIVIGALTEAGEVDEKILQEVMHKAKGMEVTFHRAFDDCIEWQKAMDVLIKHGVNRILSSGLARNVELGLPILKQMVAHSAGRIEIMTGGGINAANAGKIAQELRPNAIHFSGTVKVQQDEESLFAEPVLMVDKPRVQRILTAAGC